MTALDQFLAQTTSQMVTRDEWDQLSELGELTVRYAPLVHLWHAFCASVMISDGRKLYPMSSSGTSPEDALKQYWKDLTELPEGSTIVKNAWRADKCAYRWDNSLSCWRVVPL